jgi:hypothetical protein
MGIVKISEVISEVRDYHFIFVKTEEISWVFAAV